MRRTSYTHEPRPSFWSALRRTAATMTILSFILIVVLIGIALWLPPISLLERVQFLSYTTVPPSGATFMDPDGTAIVFPPEHIFESFRVTFDSIPRADFLDGSVGEGWVVAKDALPSGLQLKSPIYEVDVRDGRVEQTIAQIVIPNDSQPYETLDLYTWDGDSWEFVPSTVLRADDRLEARMNGAPPQNFVVMQTSASPPRVEANIGMGEQAPPNLADAITTLAIAGFYLRGDGALEIVPRNMPDGNYEIVPILRNWRVGEAPRSDLLHNMLVDPGLRENQRKAVADLLTTNPYPGVIIDYRGMDAAPAAQEEFVRFIESLAEHLHEMNRWLAVRVESPRQISAAQWNTQGYDWQALGKATDRVMIPGPVDPRAYQPGGEMEALLAFATDQIDRRKVQVELPGMSTELSGNQLRLKGYQQALQPLVARIRLEGEDGVLVPGTVVDLSVDNPRISRGLAFEATFGAYVYSYVDDQQIERTIYIENSSSFAHKLSLLDTYGVTQVMVRDIDSGDVDPALWDIAHQFQVGGGIATGPANLAVSYTVFHPDGSVLAQDSRPIENPAYTFMAPVGQGDVRVEAQVVQNNRPASPGNALSLPLATPTSAASPTPMPTATPSFATLVSAQTVNIREGPSTRYPILGQIKPNQTYRIVGQNKAKDWWQIDIGNGKKGWVADQVSTATGPLSGVATITDIPTPPPVAVAARAPAPTGGGSFGYGVQAHMVHAGDQIGPVMQKTKELGFGWVKQQIEWKVFERNQGQYIWGDMQPFIDAANGAGISLLFSVVNAPDWARESGFDGSVGGPPANPQTFANFLGALAGKYCGSSVKAIEVWNEQNLHYEWGNKPLNPGEYMALLRPAYAAIKAACPSMLVISGALTPAGDNGNKAMDDFRYLEEMFKAGLNNYMDGIGAHPSGYNVPPSKTWQEACAAIQVSGNQGFNGACDSPHHSWSFRSTMEGYRNIAVKYGARNKRIWPTEFGWAAGGAFNPAYGYANDNDFNEQASWTVEAYRMMRNWGWVGPAFLWNLNFRVVADGTEKAQWGIVSNNWSPLPIFHALRDMPK